jgi:hypothetical protein
MGHVCGTGPASLRRRIEGFDSRRRFPDVYSPDSLRRTAAGLAVRKCPLPARPSAPFENAHVRVLFSRGPMRLTCSAAVCYGLFAIQSQSGAAAHLADYETNSPRNGMNYFAFRSSPVKGEERAFFAKRMVMPWPGLAGETAPYGHASASGYRAARQDSFIFESPPRAKKRELRNELAMERFPLLSISPSQLALNRLACQMARVCWGAAVVRQRGWRLRVTTSSELVTRGVRIEPGTRGLPSASIAGGI